MYRESLSAGALGSALYLSQVLGKQIVDAQGERVAKMQDLVVRVDAEAHPPVSGLVARQGRRDFYLAWSQVAELSPQGVRLNTFKVDLQPFVRRDNEVLLRRDVLDKQLIDVNGRRVVRVSDLQLARAERQYRPVGVDASV